jgi:uncharacterized membrane protein YoaK (UPF0700 family)
VTICSFLVGGVVGVLLHRAVGGMLFLVAAGVLSGLATVEIFRAKRLVQQQAGNFPFDKR